MTHNKHAPDKIGLDETNGQTGGLARESRIIYAHNLYSVASYRTYS